VHKLGISLKNSLSDLFHALHSPRRMPIVSAMNHRFSFALAVILAGVGLLFFLLGRMKWDFSFSREDRSRLTSGGLGNASGPMLDRTEEEQEQAATSGADTSQWDAIMAKLALAQIEEKARKNEAMLQFESDAAYRKFLELAKEAGLTILNKNPKMNAVQVGFEKLATLKDFLKSNPGLGAEVMPNYLVTIPPEPKDTDQSGNTPVNGSALPLIGVKDNAAAGQGVTIAVLDSGVANLPEFSGRLSYIKAAQNPTSDLSHGTSVADLAAGPNGVAQSAKILSVEVVAADGMSDVFTLSLGIQAAVDNGARILNISLGSYDDSPMLQQALAYAAERGAIVVASNGNEGLNNATFPARSPGVVSVAAADANGQAASFSNESGNHGFIAPGLGVLAYGADGQQYLVSGTSFSTPLVSGSLAYLLGLNPQLTSEQVVQITQQYADDGGALGPDTAYGYGMIDVDGILNSNTPNLVDGRVAAHHFDGKAGGAQMNYVVQNNGTSPMQGWTLNTNSNGTQQQWEIPRLGPNQTTQITVPIGLVDAAQQYQSQLLPPQGVRDADSSNNARGSYVAPVAK
jgi:hypothetical protein